MRAIRFTLACLCCSLSQISSGIDSQELSEDELYWQEPISPPLAVTFEADIGIHMTPVGFGTQLAFYQHLSSFFQVGQSFQYFRQDSLSDGAQDLHYGVDANMRVAPFQEYMFSPFMRVALGYNQWQSLVQQNESARASYDFGLNIQLTSFFSLVLVRRELSFLSRAPETYWGQSVSGKNFASNEAMLTFSLDNRMF
ncbi:hypothetical protein [Pseudobacteriovorax antillogorgiicola]|uniref:Outer membrane protein beta-barrel domain-containing protein n=1 Tax=Pseudobacteriovorax antillogorgiicola TaxID=1513793 RepID=A0A1Y6BUD9_9BACT|nr:hypothetical protein [Pseudobacteriovorax antillogorgiicola]TCS53825.1 hypothetical protein EDD56_107134 [Pseudobacteriovorax antillogorgiicola]SMF21826.1 hypothetical protein SAMN06296036_107138 [Pseudobacteriovorax antillogorgiicola]